MTDIRETDHSVPDNIPFEQAGRYGFSKRLVLTVMMIISSPGRFFSTMHINKGYFYPVLFMLIMLFFGNIFTYIYVNAGFIPSASENLAAMIENNPEIAGRAEYMRYFVSEEISHMDIFYGTAANFLIFILLSLYWHLILRSLHIAINGLEATVRIFCYSSVVALSSAVPVSSPVLNFAVYVWWSYLVYKGISESHEVSGRLALRGLSVCLFASFIPLILATVAFL